MPAKIVVVTDADWAGDEINRRSVDCIHEYFGKHLVDSSSCSQAVHALASGESEFYGNLRGGAAGLQNVTLYKAAGIELPLEVQTDSTASM